MRNGEDRAVAGLALLRSEQYADALPHLDAAVSLEPDAAIHLSNRGYCRKVNGDFEGALADLDQAIALEPDYAKAYFNRAALHAEIGQRELALADYARLQTLGHDVDEEIAALG